MTYPVITSPIHNCLVSHDLHTSSLPILILWYWPMTLCYWRIATYLPFDTLVLTYSFGIDLLTLTCPFGIDLWHFGIDLLTLTCPFGVDRPLPAAFPVPPPCVPCHLHRVLGVSLQVRDDSLISVPVMRIVHQFLSNHFVLAVGLVVVHVVAAYDSILPPALWGSPLHKHGRRVDWLGHDFYWFIWHCKV